MSDLHIPSYQVHIAVSFHCLGCGETIACSDVPAVVTCSGCGQQYTIRAQAQISGVRPPGPPDPPRTGINEWA